MLRQIVFVYRDEFAAKLIEKLMQESGIDCYGISKVEENFAYIIDDLRPELVIVDEQSYLSSKELIEQSLLQAGAPFKSVMLIKNESKASVFDEFMPLPININTFVDEARALVEKKS